MKKLMGLYTSVCNKEKLMLLTACLTTTLFSCSKKDFQETTTAAQDVSLASTTTVNPNLLVQEDFEGSTYFPNYGTSINMIHGQENCNPSATNTNGDIEHGTTYDWTLMRETNNVFNGSKSAQFEIQKDQPLVGGSQRIRSESVIIVGKEDPRWTPDIWYSYAVFFPTVGMEPDDVHETLNQWWEDGGNNNVVRIRSNKVFFEGTTPAGMTIPYYDLFKTTASTAPVAIGTGTTSVSNMVPIVKDKWVQFVFHFVHSYGSDGLTEIWRDGVKIYEIKGCNMHAGIPKWKIGLYKASYANSTRPFRKVYFDDVRVGKQGATLADMMSTSTPPPPPPSNVAPVTKAGSDVTITLPTNTVQLAGSATDQDGSIAKLSWTKTSGGNYTISDASIANPVVTLEAGTYTFRLTSTDNLGLTSFDEVSITVKAAPTTGLAIASFTLVDAATEKDIMTITDGATISLKQLGTSKLNIRANPSSTTSNVKFELSGKQTKNATDKAAPYALMGDDGKGNYYYGNWNPPTLGSYTLKATPTYGTTTGAAGTIHFTFVQ